MKSPDEVGRDFDDYVKRWNRADYRMETSYGPAGLTTDPDAEVSWPGDEWGDIRDLEELYDPLFGRLLPGTGGLRILEIGAGGGRSTQAVASTLATRIAEYYIVDVSTEFVEVLRERLPNLPLSIEVVTDVDLSGLPANHFDLCLAQSSWSHISFYDQYRYLRDLRRLMKYNAPVVVHGQFLVGIGDDWAWNRFRRRVYQIDHRIDGVYHEFTSIGMLVEQLVRLEYRLELIHQSGFIARRIQANHESTLASLDTPISYPYLPLLLDYVRGAEPRLVEIG